jgi:hypothetical protein
MNTAVTHEDALMNQETPSNPKPSRVRNWLHSLFIVTGIKANPDKPIGNSPPADALVCAARFKQRADGLLKESDCADTGERYVLAIRSYCDAMACTGTMADAAGWPSEVQKALRSTPAELVGLPLDEQKTMALAMQRICESVVGGQVADVERSVRRPLMRPVRVVVTSLFVLGLVSLTTIAVGGHGDLAHDHLWRASSQLAVCRPVAEGGCPTRSGVFFHTAEEVSPWIEYDLMLPTNFSSVLVENARDGFRARAIPLIVEVSDDQKTWREIARVTHEFREWKTSFPTVKARYVRFRVARKTYLHLARIEIRT